MRGRIFSPTGAHVALPNKNRTAGTDRKSVAQHQTLAKCDTLHEVVDTYLPSHAANLKRHRQRKPASRDLQ